jgi:outer membrane protein OmpA-like peptidoglycan-associated protein
MGSSGGDLFQIGTDGAENNLGTPSSAPQTTGADFIPNTNFLLTASNTGNFDLTDVASPALTTVALGSTGSTFAASDITWTENSSGTDYVGYGLKGTGANAATLYIVTLPVTDIPSSSANWGSIPANPLAVTVDTGISLSGGTATASDSYGAAYSDSTGDAFFYDNTQEELFEATSAQIAALGNQTFTFRASSASTSGFSTGGNDGASCPNATSPFAAPTPINDSYTIATNTSLSATNASTSVFSNDQVVSGTSYNVDNVVLEPGANQVTQNFTSSSSSAALVGANGTLDVTNANLGYFTFTPDSGFTGTESFTYNIDETSPNNGVSNTVATVSINVVHQQVVSWAIGNDLSTSVASTAPSPATDLGGAPLTYLVNVSDANTADCSVNVTTGVITYFSAGVCTVDVSAAATSSYTAGFAELTFDVTSLTVPTLFWSPSPSSTPVSPSGTTITPAPTTNSAGAITYAIASSNNTAGCTLASASAPLVLMSTTQGVCSITATVAANGSYSAETITSPFAILATPTLTWAPTPTSFTTAQSPQTIIGVTTNSDGAITYVIDGTGDTAGCTLSSSGAPVILHFATAGGCTVDAAVGASTTYAAAAISQTFSVTVAPPGTITQSAPFANISSDTAGQVFSDQLVTTGQSGTESFSAGGTLPPGVAVSSSGHIASNGMTPAGVFTLHGTDSDTSSDSGTWTYTFTVTAVTPVTVRGGPITEGNSSASVNAGTPFSGTIATSGNDGAVTFTTLTGGAFTVNSNGAISAPPTLIPGTYSVTGTDTDGRGHTGVWSFTLTVVASPSTISVAPPNPGAIGQTYSPVVVTSGPAVTVTTSTPSICRVRNSVVTYLASGTCTLTFATVASVDYDATTVTQHITVRVPRKVSLTLFNFANDESTLTPSMRNRLSTLAGTITRDDDTHISISGYASSTGGAAHNVLLSRQRAEIVTKRLLTNLQKDGATVALLRSLGRGATNFVSSNSAAAANRRVSVSAW